VIPIATTLITVLRAPPEDAYAEPYSGTSTTGLAEVVRNVRAVIDIPVIGDAGREVVKGGEQTVVEYRFSCDVADVQHSDYVRDELTGVLYRVQWVFQYHDDHIEGGLRTVEGLV
jgi:hypothetical protein